MATVVVMPKQGQSVESCIIVAWKKQPGASIAEGDVLCEVETDKAVLEVPSPVGGILLATFFTEGDDVPVLTPIAAVGEAGEDVSALRPGEAVAPPPVQEAPSLSQMASSPAAGQDARLTASTEDNEDEVRRAISPRARNLAARKQVALDDVQGSGPGGRIIERDVQAAFAAQPKVSPVARAMVEQGDYTLPDQGSGPGGRIMARDLAAPLLSQTPPPTAGEHETLAVRGTRKLIAERMLESLQTTAQLTLHATADARTLLALRKRFKASDAALGLQGVTINDLILFAVARILPNYPALNATLRDQTITQYRAVHLGFAVDTPRGLLVPVIRDAHARSLAALAQESKRLSGAIQANTITPDEMTGGTFTVTNLGNLGIEQFTPILYVPQVAILGVGSINLKPVPTDGDFEGDVAFVPHVALSLTINHQVVDGAPGARFLQALAAGIKDLDLLLAL